jgi:hypothetical protein
MMLEDANNLVEPTPTPYHHLKLTTNSPFKRSFNRGVYAEIYMQSHHQHTTIKTQKEDRERRSRKLHPAREGSG